ncbi:MAG: cell division protein FtsL [Deltaproteobacteria bacterium]|nr:cell division protein FtsL [Deltaproteobacteria bacterium]
MTSSAEAREAASPQGLRARFLALWLAAVIATAAAFVVHLAVRFETVDLGYQVDSARREQRRLVESRRLLSLEAATLSQGDRVEAVARGTLHMAPPEPSQVIGEGSAPRRATAGGVR